MLTSLHGAGQPAGSLSHTQSPLLTFFLSSNPDHKAEGWRLFKKKCGVELSAFYPKHLNMFTLLCHGCFFGLGHFQHIFCERFQNLAWCGWFSSARRDCGPFLKTAALFYTCLFLSGWLDWRAEINITWRRSLHVQCSGAESLASLPWLLKGVVHLPCPEGQTHTHACTHRFNQQTAFHQLPIKTPMPLQPCFTKV